MTLAPWSRAGFALVAAVVLSGSAQLREADTEAVAARRLEPAAFRCEPGRPIGVRIVGGDRPAGGAWRAEDVRWMLVRVAGTQHNFDAPPLDESARPIATLELAGVGLIGIDLQPREVEVQAASLRRFLEERGTREQGAEVAPDRPTVRVRRVESFTTLVRCGAPGAAAGRSEATGRTVQEAEIRPLMDPAALRPPTDLPLKLYLGGSPASGARLIATHVPSGAARECRADGSGACVLTLDAPGQWRLEFHSLTRAAEGEEPALVLRSASLTFEVPDAPAQPAGEGASR
jgi:hypothetical protein